LAREIQGFGCGNDGWVVVPDTIGPIVGNDGYGYVLVRNNTGIRSGGCGMSGTVTQDVGVKLLRISPAGALSPTVIYSQHCVHGFSNFTICDNPPGLANLVPDGVGGILVRASYTTAAYNDHTWDTEGRLTRITPQGIQYDIPSANFQMEMTSDAGLAVVRDFAAGVPTGVRAMNVLDGTTVWSVANGSLRPLTALPDGGVALIDSGTNQLTEYSATGAAGQSGAFDWHWTNYNQSAFGMWTGVDDVSGQLTSRVSLPLNEAIGTYSQSNSVGSGVGTQQMAPRSKSFSTREDAALAALDYLSFITDITHIEWGGYICEKGNGFEWSLIVTSHDSGSVFIPRDLCSVDYSYAASYHTHPREFGNDSPSGNDLANSDLSPGLPSYLSAPEPTGLGLLRKRHYLKWWNTGDRNSQQNVCVRQANGAWYPYSQIAGTNGARCDTPTP
jgi:hypothetical protein